MKMIKHIAYLGSPAINSKCKSMSNIINNITLFSILVLYR